MAMHHLEQLKGALRSCPRFLIAPEAVLRVPQVGKARALWPSGAPPACISRKATVARCAAASPLKGLLRVSHRSSVVPHLRLQTIQMNTRSRAAADTRHNEWSVILHAQAAFLTTLRHG